MARVKKKPAQRAWQPMERGLMNPRYLATVYPDGVPENIRLEVWGNDLYEATVEHDIENGMAVEMGERSGFWTYTATQPVAPGTDIFIEVVGVDHTGKRVKLTENPIVGAAE